MCLDPDLVSGLCLKDCMCTVNRSSHLAKISKSQQTYSQFTYRVPGTIRILSASRTNLEGCLWSWGAAHCHAGESSRLWTAHYLWSEMTELYL